MIRQTQTAQQNIPKIIPLLAVLLLAGCATRAPTTREVKVPVSVPCVGNVPVAPVYEFDKLTSTASDGEKVLALARDWPRGRKYEGELEAVVAGCR